MPTQHASSFSRRRFLEGLMLVGTAGLLGVHPQPSAAEPAPQTTQLRLFKIAGICIAPQYVAEEFLRGEGFTDVHYVETVAGAELTKALASGEAHLSLSSVAPVILRLDAGDPLVMLAGVHVGCFELFGLEHVRTIHDLKGKTVAVQALGSSQHVFLASMAAYVGLDASKAIHWVTYPPAEAMQLFAVGQIDTYLGFPPDPQHLRGQKIGHVVVNSSVDRPWSHYFCCVATGNQEFVRKHPVATKRALRAVLKATDVCAHDPERVAQAMVDKGFTPRYDYALQTMQEVSYNRWREYNPGGYGALLWAAPARGRDDQEHPPKTDRSGHGLALPHRAEEGVEGLAGAGPVEKGKRAIIFPTDVRGSRQREAAEPGNRRGSTVSLLSHAPNEGLEPTPYSVCSAPASSRA